MACVSYACPLSRPRGLVSFGPHARHGPGSAGLVAPSSNIRPRGCCTRQTSNTRQSSKLRALAPVPAPLPGPLQCPWPHGLAMTASSTLFVYLLASALRSRAVAASNWQHVLGQVLLKALLPAWLLVLSVYATSRSAPPLALLLGALHALCGAAVGYALAAAIQSVSAEQPVLQDSRDLAAKAIAESTAAALGNPQAAVALLPLELRAAAGMEAILVVALASVSAAAAPSAVAAAASAAGSATAGGKAQLLAAGYLLGAALPTWALLAPLAASNSSTTLATSLTGFSPASLPDKGQRPVTLPTPGAAPAASTASMWSPTLWLKIQDNQEVLLTSGDSSSRGTAAAAGALARQQQQQRQQRPDSIIQGQMTPVLPSSEEEILVQATIAAARRPPRDGEESIGAWLLSLLPPVVGRALQQTSQRCGRIWQASGLGRNLPLLALLAGSALGSLDLSAFTDAATSFLLSHAWEAELLAGCQAAVWDQVVAMARAALPLTALCAAAWALDARSQAIGAGPGSGVTSSVDAIDTSRQTEMAAANNSALPGVSSSSSSNWLRRLAGALQQLLIPSTAFQWRLLAGAVLGRFVLLPPLLYACSGVLQSLPLLAPMVAASSGTGGFAQHSGCRPALAVHMAISPPDLMAVLLLQFALPGFPEIAQAAAMLILRLHVLSVAAAALISHLRLAAPTALL